MRRGDCGLTLVQLMAGMAGLSVLAAFATVSHGRTRMSANHNNAGAALAQLRECEAIWRMRDVDGNGVADHWTRDVAGFHCLHDIAGKPVGLVSLDHARAGAAPGRAYAGMGGVAGTLYGYRFQAMRIDQDGASYVDPAAPPPRAANAPPGACTNARRYGFAAWPARYGVDGVLYWILGEDGVPWQKDPGTRAPVLLDRRPGAPPGTDTEWSQFAG